MTANMNAVRPGYSDPLVYAGNKNSSLQKNNPRKMRTGRRKSWTTDISINYPNAERRCSTSSSITNSKSSTAYSLNKYKSGSSIKTFKNSTSGTSIQSFNKWKSGSSVKTFKNCVTGSSIQTLSKCKSGTSIKSFSSRYHELCYRYHSTPSTGVTANLPKRILDIAADRLKIEDWKPLLEAISSDKELHMIAIRSKYPYKRGYINIRETKPGGTKHPALYSNYCLSRLNASLAHCIAKNACLTCLELDGIQLHPKYLSILTQQGLRNSINLQHLSFERCSIGDVGAEIVCREVKYLTKITTLNLAGCNLTPDGLFCIASLLKVQKINRAVEAWHKSLRYQQPNLDAMWGLRRITLNSNPLIGDDGAKILCEALEDDYWVKAIDLQKSNIGIAGAEKIISLLKMNDVIAIIDIRENRKIPDVMVKQIMHMLSMNNMERKPEYHWLSLSPDLSVARSTDFLNKNKMFYGKTINQRLNSCPVMAAKQNVLQNRSNSLSGKG